MPFSGVGRSKFRNVFGNPYKKERCYEAIRITKSAWDGGFCAVNPKFLAVVLDSSGGGPFLVLPIDKVGRVPINAPRVTGHRGATMDLQWNPFDDNIIASSSEDCTIKIWYIPDGGISEDLVDYVGDLRGHERKVGIIRWHPCASGILASAGFDFVIIVWDVEREAAVTILKGHSDAIYSLSFNYDGSLIATACKDKKIRVIDPREGKLVAHGMGHQGPKASHVVFMGDSNMLFSTGFSRSNERQLAVWNAGNLNKALKIEAVDSTSGHLIPYYDNDTKVVFLAGKGDGNIRYFQLSQEEPYVTYLSEYSSSKPQRGFGVMPKRGLDVTTCEIFRFYKMHNNGFIEPLAMVVPRQKTGIYRELYPETPSMDPALSADEWLSGRNANPNLVDLLEGLIAGESASEQQEHTAMNISTRSVSRPHVGSQVQNRNEISQRVGTPVRVESQMATPPVPPQRNESSKVYSEQLHSDRNHHVTSRAVPSKETDVQYVRATEVTARKVSDNRTTVSSNQSSRGVQRSNDNHTWDLESLRLAYQDQKEEISFLKTQLKAKEARIWQLEQENLRCKERPRV